MISAATGAGLEELVDAVGKTVDAQDARPGPEAVPNEGDAPAS